MRQVFYFAESNSGSVPAAIQQSWLISYGALQHRPIHPRITDRLVGDCRQDQNSLPGAAGDCRDGNWLHSCISQHRADARGCVPDFPPAHAL
jgi:hypothetical protein